MRSEEEILELLAKARDDLDEWKGKGFFSLCFWLEGLIETLKWVLGEEK